MKATCITEICTDLTEGGTSSDYVAVELLWGAVLKAAHDLPGGSERSRLEALVDALDETDARSVLALPAVDRLLDLDPPLESVAHDPQEHLDPSAIQKAIREIRDARDAEPRYALKRLGWILKRIRDRRVHVVKSRGHDRNVEILSLARAILAAFAEAGFRFVSNRGEA